MNELFYITTGEYIGNAMIWWGQNSRGYTTDINQAGKYSREKAESICRGRSTERAYSCETIDNADQAKKTIIDGQYIGHNDMAFNLKSLTSQP